MIMLMMIMIMMMMMGDMFCVNRLKVCDKRVLRIRRVSSDISSCVIGWAISEGSRD